MVTRIALLASTTILVSACPSGLYEPCSEPQDCDPIQADGCFVAPHTGVGFCTLLCTEDSDCPAGQEGQLASCEPIGEGAKVCRIE